MRIIITPQQLHVLLPAIVFARSEGIVPSQLAPLS